MYIPKKGGHVHMEIKYGVTGKQRKAMVTAIAEIDLRKKVCSFISLLSMDMVPTGTNIWKMVLSNLMGQIKK